MSMFRVPARFRLADLHSLRRRIEPVAEFDEMSLMPTMRQALNELQAHRPTPIQAIAIPQLASRFTKDSTSRTVMSAETGTGKTLAYLIPLMQHLKQQEQSAGEQKSVYNYIRAAVLVPTNELVDQIYRTGKVLAHNVKLRVDKLGHDHKHRLPCDMIVSTPSKLLKMEKELRCQLEKIVIDEADTLLADEEFREEIGVILRHQKHPPSLVYCSATITDGMLNYLKDCDQPDIHYITTTHLHQPKPRVQITTIVVKLPEEGRFQKIAKIINPKEKTLIFCNSSAVCQRLYTYMQTMTRILPVCLHGGIPEVQRSALLKSFKTDPSCSVMIATDLMARGLDLPSVQHVVLCELPQSRADYLHRIGRVGRVGLQQSRGRVTIVIGSRQVALAHQLLH